MLTSACVTLSSLPPPRPLPAVHPKPTHFPFILLSARSFVWISWPLRWLVSVLCTEGLALSPVYIKAAFTGLITRIRTLLPLCAWLLCSHSLRLFSVARAGQHMAAAANSLHRGTRSSEQGLLLFGPLLLPGVMTFVGRRIGVEGLVYPRGETGRGETEKRGMEGGRQRHVDRQECGLWKYELIFFFPPPAPWQNRKLKGEQTAGWLARRGGAGEM